MIIISLSSYKISKGILFGLIRVSFGPFNLKDLPAGELEEIKSRVLNQQLGLSKPIKTTHIKNNRI